MLSLTGSLILIIAAFRLWPHPSLNRTDIVFHTQIEDLIHLEEIQLARGQSFSPPPPTPLVPIPVPDDLLLQEAEIEFSAELPVTNVLPPGAGGETNPSYVARADEAPRPMRFVEPEYPQEARRRRIRAQIQIEVLVDEEGVVRESRITEMFLLGDRNERPRPVEQLGYGLEEAALGAAQRWRFRPGRHNGELVRTYATLTFSFGV